MRKWLLKGAVILIVLVLAQGMTLRARVQASPAQQWHKATPIMQTRWFDEVSPTNALPEYPRPQMTRTEWLTLNGLWEFAAARAGEQPPFNTTLNQQILVPYPVEAPLSGIGHTETRMWYRRMFNAPNAWNGQHLRLNFGAVDWQSAIYVNGQRAGEHTGGYDGFSIDITPYLKAAGPQEIIVGVYDPGEAGGQPRGKQSFTSHEIWYTSTSGIWQTVWIEPVAPVAIQDLRLITDIDAGMLRVTVALSEQASGYTLNAVAFDGGSQVASISGLPGEEFLLPVPEAKLWSPEHPFLYDLKLTLLKDGAVIDEVGSYFGMRKISLGEVGGVTRILLNNHFVFQIGPLDQGFWPDGIYTAPTDEALRYDLEMEKKLGWNMVRKHIKVEPERWYYWADKLGLLVWQDMPSADAANKIANPPGNFEAELRAMIAGRRNHPSIIMWVIFNEEWGQKQFGLMGTAQLTKVVRTLDPARLVNSATGWVDYGISNVVDWHTYVGPESPKPEFRRAAVQGEFGGLGLEVEGHRWPLPRFAYEWQPSGAALTARYIELIRKAQVLMQNPGLSAAVYTEITDIEHELNGLLTYDRAVIKVDVDAVREANQALIAASEALK